MTDVKKIIESAYSKGRTALLEHESMEVLSAYDIPGNVYKIAKSSEEAVNAAKEMGFPVVAKIVSPDILHKSDAGGVKLNLKSENEVKDAYDEIIKNAKNYKSDAEIIGINIQPFAKEGIAELIIGLTTDPQFGPALMFGLGGIFVEIYKDVSFRVCPITEYDAKEMIHEIQAFPILDGFRGRPKADIETLVDLLLKVSKLAMDHPQVDQLDLNPVIVYDDGVAIVDARIILAEKEE